MSVSSKITTTLFAVFVVIATVAIAVTSAFAKPYEISNKALKATYVSNGLDISVSATYQKGSSNEISFVSSRGVSGEISLFGRNEETLIADSFAVTSGEDFAILTYFFKNNENEAVKVRFADLSTNQNAELSYLKVDSKISNSTDARTMLTSNGVASPVQEFTIESKGSAYYYVLATISNGATNAIFANGFRWTISRV